MNQHEPPPAPVEPQPDNPVNAAEDFRFALRPGEDGDITFVADSWRRSHDEHGGTRCPGGLPEYIATQRQVIVQALATSQLVVAYPEAPEKVPQQILGWACYRPGPLPTIHYVYVKPYYRQGGIGRSLIDHAMGPDPVAVVFTSQSWHGRADKTKGIRAVMERARAHGIRVELNPALIFT